MTLSEGEALELLISDVEAAEQKARLAYGSNWDELLEAYRVLWMDIAFNVGNIRGWPKLQAALGAGDLEQAEIEYNGRMYRDQDGQRRPLTARTAAVWELAMGCLEHLKQQGAE